MFFKKGLFSGQNPANAYPASESGVQFFKKFLDKLDSVVLTLCSIYVFTFTKKRSFLDSTGHFRTEVYLGLNAGRVLDDQILGKALFSLLDRPIGVEVYLGLGERFRASPRASN